MLNRSRSAIHPLRELVDTSYRARTVDRKAKAAGGAQAKDDYQRQVSVDLSGTTTAELQLLLALVQRGALRPAADPDEPVIVQPATIDAVELKGNGD